MKIEYSNYLIEYAYLLLEQISEEAEGSRAQLKLCKKCADVLFCAKRIMVSAKIDMSLKWLGARNELQEWYKWHLDLDNNYKPRYRLGEWH